MTTIVIEGKGAQNIDVYLKMLRPGDEASVETLARLAPTRALLRKYVTAIYGKGCTIFESKTQRKLDTVGVAIEAVLDAVDELAQDRRVHSPEDAAKFGSMGGRPRKERMSLAKAEKIWFDSRIKTVPEAIARMDGWSTRMAYREFGPRNITVGRPRK